MIFQLKTSQLHPQANKQAWIYISTDSPGLSPTPPTALNAQKCNNMWGFVPFAQYEGTLAASKTNGKRIALKDA